MSRADFLFIQSTTEVGGAEAVLLNAFAASEELRSRSIVATLGFGRGNLPERLRTIGVDVVEIEAGRLRDPLRLGRTILRLRELVRARGLRLIVGNGTHPQVYAGLLASMSGVPSVYYVHAIHREPLRRNGVIDILAIKSHYDLALANSKASMGALLRLRKRVSARVLYPGVPIPSLEAREVQMRRHELGAGSATVLFGVFGRLQRWKGQDLFVEAAARVVESVPEARFAIVGGSLFGLEPEFAVALRARIAKLGLQDRFTLTGFRTDVPELMAACDVVCHTSRVAEPFGMVVVEAMAVGRPIVATAGGGPGEVIQNGSNGRLVSSDSVPSLSEAMIELGKNAADRARLGEAGRTTVQNEFTSTRMAERMLSSLGELL